MIPYFSLSHIQAGPINIQVWGFFVSLGILFALAMSINRAKRYSVEIGIIYDIFLIALIAMIAGSKIFYVFFLSEPDIAVNKLFSDGGFSFLGGAIFSSVMIFVYLKYKKMDVMKVADILTPGLIVALIFVRIGCSLVYDHIGNITRLPWGIAYIDRSIRHPVSLYLLLGNIVIFLIIWYLEKRKPTHAAGVTFLVFLALYSVFRFILDFTRCSDLGFCDARYLSLTYTQLFLIIIFPASVCLLINSIIINKKNE